MPKQLFILLLFLWISSFVSAQSNSYDPIINPKSYNRYSTKIDKRYESDLTVLPKKNKKELKRVYEARYKRIRQQLYDGHFLFQDSINQYFNNILTNILEANPSIKQQKDIRLFISRYFWPNASCIGEGSIILNIGLLRRLENESQVAFVIAHELAHYREDHVNKKILERITKFNSREAKKVIKKARREKYNANQKVEQFFKEVILDDRQHSRTKESESDSLAIEFLKNTSYDLSQGIKVLEILDTVDKEKYQSELKIKERFNSTEYAFKNRWLLKESGLSMKKVDDFSWESDALKTHPECKERIAALNRIIPSSSNKNSPSTEVIQDYNDIVRIADFEMVASSAALGDLGRSLYYCLQLLNEYPDNAWLHAMIGILFYDIYVAQEEHTLGIYVDLPSNRFEEDYRELLQFIHNLRLKEMGNISFFYIQKHRAAHQENEHFLYAMLLVSDLVDDLEEVEMHKKEYLSKYKKGIYRQHVHKF